MDKTPLVFLFGFSLFLQISEKNIESKNVKEETQGPAGSALFVTVGAASEDMDQLWHHPSPAPVQLRVQCGPAPELGWSI